MIEVIITILMVVFETVILSRIMTMNQLRRYRQVGCQIVALQHHGVNYINYINDIKI
jgi:hypothetical protein